MTGCVKSVIAEAIGLKSPAKCSRFAKFCREN